MIARLWDFSRTVRVALAVRTGALYLRFLKATGRVQTGRGVTFRGLPLVDIREGASVVIGEGSMLNSCNIGYHLSMFGPVKLLADKPGARIVIGENSRVHASCLHAQESITIGDRCLIAANCQIMDSSGHDLAFDNPGNRINTGGKTEPVVIEDDVWLAAGVYVMPGVRIGRGSVIAAGSVVTRSIPANCLAGGVPCRVLHQH